MVKQLEAIEEHNSKLPPKKAKNALPEIYAPNVYAKFMVKRDPKKGTVSAVKQYRNIGLVDESN